MVAILLSEAVTVEAPSKDTAGSGQAERLEMERHSLSSWNSRSWCVVRSHKQNAGYVVTQPLMPVRASVIRGAWELVMKSLV